MQTIFENVSALSVIWLAYLSEEISPKFHYSASVAVMKYWKREILIDEIWNERNRQSGKKKKGRKKERQRVELSGSTSFGFIDTFFSFHYCNICKWLNGVFVQQFSDLYLSEVMGAHKGCRVEAQTPREPYFTRGSMAITCTHTNAPISCCCWIW